MSREKPLIAKLSELDRKLFQVRDSVFFLTKNVPYVETESLLNKIAWIVGTSIGVFYSRRKRYKRQYINLNKGRNPCLFVNFGQFPCS
jgi:hypothetical protein